MRCDDVRVALSARLDGEQSDVLDQDLDHHVAGCADCRTWLTGAEHVTRLVRLRPLEVPDLTGSIMRAVVADRVAADRPVAGGSGQDAARLAAAAAAAGAAERERARRQVLRLAVGAVAVAQLVAALLPVLGLVATGHTRHELATLDTAVAVGFLFAAWRPAMARAYLPVAYVLAVGLAVTAAIGVADGVTTLSQETAHLVPTVQAALLWALSRTERPGWRRTAAA